MKGDIKNINIYYSDLNRLITDCVSPEMEKRSSDISWWFWERGCIGGKHLKVRWLPCTDASIDMETDLLKNFQAYIIRHPSDSPSSYNAEAGKKLAKTENRLVSEDELKFRIDYAVSHPYTRTADENSSDDTIDLLHYFLADTREFCERNMSSKNGEQMLFVMQLMVVFAVEQFGNIAEGCITFRAHWDNYELWFKPEILAQRIKQHYEANKPQIQEVINDILERHRQGDLEKDARFVEWLEIIRKYRVLVYQKYLAGVTLISDPINEDDVIQTSILLGNDESDSRAKHFLSKLFNQTNYLGGVANNPGLQLTRITVNLIYHLFTNLGLSSFQRMSCTYFVHRSVEDIFDIDLVDVLDEHMKKALGEKYVASNSQTL